MTPRAVQQMLSNAVNVMFKLGTVPDDGAEAILTLLVRVKRDCVTADTEQAGRLMEYARKPRAQTAEERRDRLEDDAHALIAAADYASAEVAELEQQLAEIAQRRETLRRTAAGYPGEDQG